MLPLALVLALSAQAPQEAATTVDPLTVEALRNRPPATLRDSEIERQLNALREAEPDRVVCVKTLYSGSFIRRNVCATLRGWYDLEVARDTKHTVGLLLKDESGSVPARPGPPDELVTLIKDRMDNAKARAQAADRARQRMEARADKD